MKKSNFRVIYGALTGVVVIPLLLSLLATDVPVTKGQSRFWAGALVLVFISYVYNEIRDRRASEGAADPSKGPDPLGTVADRLAESVYAQWRDEANAHRIDKPARLPVSWRFTDEGPFNTWQEIDEVSAGWRPDNRWAESDGRSGDLGGHEEESLDKFFTTIPTRRLVILGRPGAGKTVLLVKLLLALRDGQNRRTDWQARRREDKVVPFLVSLSGWNPEREELRAWLADRLVAEHPSLQAPEHAGEGAQTRAQALVRQNLILPVLDGFDEIPGAMRVTALEKIENALNMTSDDPMAIIISGRSDEFRRAAENTRSQLGVVPGAAVVVLEDVSPDDAKAFLGQGGEWRWDEVFQKIGTAEPVGQVLRTPLMLSLAHAVYNWHPQGHESTPLPPPNSLLAYHSPGALEDHLLDAFVPAAYRNRPEQAESAERTLRYMAAYLEDGERHPSRRPPPDPSGTVEAAKPKSERIGFAWWRLRAVAAPVVGLTIGVPGAAAVGLVAAVIPGLGAGLGLGMITGVAVAMAAGLIGGRTWRLPRSRDGVGTGIVCGFIGALIGAVPTGIILHATGHAPSAVQGLMGSLGAGIGPGVVGGKRRGIPAAAVGGVVCAVTAGSLPGIPAGIIDGLGAWLVIALTISVSAVRAPSQGVGRMRSKAGYLTGIVVGLAIGAAVAQAKGPVIGLIAGTVSALAGGFASGLEGIPADSTLAQAAASPGELLARDRGAFWLVAVVGGGAFGLGAGLAVRPEVGLAGALAVGLTAASLQASWLPYVITRWWCGATGRLRWDLQSFLEDAYRRDIFRQVGGLYQFRHIELQRRLAHHYRDQSPARDG